MMKQIERGIFYDDGYLGVTLGALVFSHGLILIDAPLRAEDARSWRSALINQRGGPNRLLVSLDAHPDRTLGTRALDSTILSHEKAALIFRNRPTIFKGQGAETGAIWETYNEAIGLRWAPPDITFTERMSLHWGGPEIILESHPGPTPGSIWVVIPDAKVVFVGDMIVLDQPPFLATADLTNWIDGVDLLLKSYGDYAIISGRGGLASQEHVHFHARFLRKVLQMMEPLAERDAPPEATLDLIPPLMAEFSPAKEWQERFEQRLKHGLVQGFIRRYRSPNILEAPEEEDDEE